ncbi:hypothetical protein [Myxococcus sp. RHSTA-1-4]|uniref:hypothetical protein n=1 Tax=Myxococcus sp. RHSTA-1-4 TaxID=2874601 RepID=UPI001CBE71CE|nr:hypothetical protein [Myxococcus sp. RHSTA-1-4]MBZ4422791.1 hypothetical protein [Myxococcus sp. RHSTA-1-4]
MSGVLTKGSRVACSHTGGVQTGPGGAKLTVKRQAVLRAADVAGRGVDSAACTNPVTQTTRKCTTVLAVTAGPATRLTVGNVPVLLDTAAGTTDGPGTLAVDAQQTKLKAK